MLLTVERTIYTLVVHLGELSVEVRNRSETNLPTDRDCWL